MKRIALDTNIAIDILNGNQETINQLRNYELICLPITVCGELLYGAKNSSRAKLNEPKYQQFINQCYILDSSIVIAEEYARIRKSLKNKGRPIPEYDIWISAICIVNEVSLYSRDKHFVHIDELELVR